MLSFPNTGARGTSSEPASHPAPPLLLGDVVLARETVSAEAAAQKKTLAAHASHLVVHGVLHLLGHDHATEIEADAMEGLETRILAALGIADPYAATPCGGRAQATVER